MAVLRYFNPAALSIAWGSPPLCVEGCKRKAAAAKVDEGDEGLGLGEDQGEGAARAVGLVRDRELVGVELQGA
jgi:hypothetical protein